MLIKVFTIWIMATNITALEPKENYCRMWFIDKHYIDFRNKGCNVVASEVNKQLEK